MDLQTSFQVSIHTRFETVASPSTSIVSWPQRRRVPAEVQASRIEFYFRARGNALASVREISEATGLTRATINAVLYSSSEKDRFKSDRRGPKKMLWQMASF